MAAEFQSSSASAATGLKLCWGTLENIRWQHRDVPGPALEALRTLLERQGAERCAVTRYHIQTTELTAPSHIFTPCPSTGPNHMGGSLG